MKKYVPVVLLCACCLGLVVTGCGTTPAAKTTQAEGLLIPSVNAAMTTWKTYVESGKATQAQINNVQAAYNVYYTAQLSVEATLINVVANSSTNSADMTAAQASVNLAENSLVSLINSYIK